MASEAKHTPFAAEDLAYLRERGFVQTAEGIEQLTAQRDAALVAAEEAKKVLGRLLNAKIDLETGHTKSAVAKTLSEIARDLEVSLSSLPTAQVKR